MAIVVPPFVPADFLALYPNYSVLSTDQLNNLWLQIYPLAMPIIGLLQDSLQAPYWYVAMAHACQIAVSGLNGRVSGASEGSVSGVTTVMTDGDDMQSFWNKTAYGQTIWNIMRTRNMIKGGARYIAAPCYY